MFSPVPVGLETHPKQIYELYNGGAVPVQYQLDLTALHYVQEVCLPMKIPFQRKYLFMADFFLMCLFVKPNPSMGE